MFYLIRKSKKEFSVEKKSCRFTKIKGKHARIISGFVSKLIVVVLTLIGAK
jgi:hypothetical protein